MDTVYQPIVQLSDSSIKGYEGLTRFPFEASPSHVFENARKKGYGLDLELYAARLAIDNFDFESMPDTYLSVNFSGYAISSGLEEKFKIGETAVQWDRLVIEVTEHIEIKDYVSFNRTLDCLRERGTKIAVDDFGKGCAGLEHVIGLKPDIIKVDRNFIQKIDSCKEHRAVVTAIINMAHELGKVIVAEGIECSVEKARCEQLNADLGQGYFLGRPVLAADLFKVPTESKI